MTEVATPRPAATILLLRDGAAGLEVFMVVRHHAIDFASGALVFPGGRVEEDDHALAARLDAGDPGRDSGRGAGDQDARALRRLPQPNAGENDFLDLTPHCADDFH